MRIRHALTTTVAGGAALGLVALTPFAAHAAGAQTKDVYNDVVKVAEDAGTVQGSTTNVKSVDANQVTINHNTQIVWNFIVKDLKPNDAYSAFGVLKTDGGKTYMVRSNNKYADNGIALYVKQGQNVNEVTCKNGLSRKSDATANVITLRVKRSCVGNPASINFGGGLAGFTKAGDILVDDASKKADPPSAPIAFKLSNKSVAFG